jgi:hypothetical protein
VFFFSNAIKTPLPWLRLDALLLLIVWAFVYINPVKNVTTAWRLAGICIPISFGWVSPSPVSCELEHV